MHTEFYLPGYPYHPDVLHEWMEIPNIYDSSHGVIKVYNGASLTVDSVCQDLRNSLGNNRHEFYYHATSWMSASAIYENGVNVKKGGKSQDFSDSDGYYLHKMLKPAVRWAKRKSGEQAAILVYAYTIPPKFQVLNLCGLRNEQLWENVVKLSDQEIKNGRQILIHLQEMLTVLLVPFVRMVMIVQNDVSIIA